MFQYVLYYSLVFVVLNVVVVCINENDEGVCCMHV
jgi:hypothetical protein